MEGKLNHFLAFWLTDDRVELGSEADDSREALLGKMVEPRLTPGAIEPSACEVLMPSGLRRMEDLGLSSEMYLR